jgi:acyl-CoA synthetase (AMP-forming)/AMP-acid ligase II
MRITMKYFTRPPSELSGGIIGVNSYFGTEEKSRLTEFFLRPEIGLPADGIDPQLLADKPAEEEVKRFFLERGAPYAHPRRVFFLDQLPLGGTGKLDRSALKRRAAALPPLESQR